MSIQLNRLNKLKESIQDKSQALLITNEINIYYFSGFQHSEGAMLVTMDEAYLLVDFRYIEAAKKIASGCKVIMFKSLNNSILELLKAHGIKNILIENDTVTLSAYHRINKAFSEAGVSVCSDDSLTKAILDLRIIKDELEIEYLYEAQRITEKAFLEVLNYVRPGVSERTVSIELEHLMKKYGASHVSFDLITITGTKTSLPHGVPSEDIIKEGDFFTMDIGSLFEGYHSDMTRTVAVKSCSDEQRRIYDIVLNAQLTALYGVKAGVKAAYVDKLARDVISNAGYGEQFGHSTGHGVGLNIHEEPFVSAKGDKTLSENMVITVEPGIYLENRFGVRIEDMVLVKENGFENFATLSKELIIV